MQETHEYVNRMESLARVDRGVVCSCTTSEEHHVDVEITVCSPHIVRLRMCPDPALLDVPSLLDIRQHWESCAFGVEESPDQVCIDTGALQLCIQKDPWRYSLTDDRGAVVLGENTSDRDAHMNYRSLPLGFTMMGGRARRTTETLTVSAGEHYYGLGEHFTRLDKLGQHISLWNTNPYGAIAGEAYKNIPFLLSTKGYGIFCNSTHRVDFSIASRSLGTMSIVVPDPRLDLFLIYGPELKQVLDRYTDITGKPSLPPLEAFGLWCAPGPLGSTVESAVRTAKRFREMDIPLDHLTHMTGLARLPGQTHVEQVAKTAELAKELGKLGVRTGIYVAPLLNKGSEMEREIRERGYAIVNEDGEPYEVQLGMRPAGEGDDGEYSLAMLDRDEAWRERHNRIFYDPCLMPDFTNPDAVAWWKEKIEDFMRAGCYFVAMSDFGEDVPADAHYHNGRPGSEMHNVYQLLYQRATFEAVAESTGHRGLVNARSGTAGMQRYPICWCGDPNCSWEDFRATLRAGLSIGMSGVPFWSCDNGGFSAKAGNLTDHLWIRWTQWSMFQSNTRLLGTSPPPRVPWSFGEQAVHNFRKYAKLRYRLMPYIYSQAHESTRTGLPMMRAMVLEYQQDPRTYDLEDQYMFGDALLIAPVCSPSNQRSVYLPQGSWFDYWSGETLEGPLTVTIEPDLETLPIYVKADSIIPMGPDLAYVGEKPLDPLTLDVWVRASAEAYIYHDDETWRCSARRAGDQMDLRIDATPRVCVARFHGVASLRKVEVGSVAIPRLESAGELLEVDEGWLIESPSVVSVKFRIRDGTTNAQIAF